MRKRNATILFGASAIVTFLSLQLFFSDSENVQTPDTATQSEGPGERDGSRADAPPGDRPPAQDDPTAPVAEVADTETLANVIRGVVYTPDGFPAAGALVRCQWRPEWVRDRDSDGEGETPEASNDLVTAGADGRFAIHEVPVGWTVLSVEHPSGSVVERVRMEPANRVREITLVLSKGSFVGGIVVDRQGAPIAGAKVMPLACDGDFDFLQLCEAKATVTGEDGRFELRPVREGAWLLHTSVSGFAPVVSKDIPSGTDNTRIVLGAGAELRVQVRSVARQAPVDGVAVVVGYENLVVEPERATTDGTGTALFGPVGMGTYRISIDDDFVALAMDPPVVHVDPARIPEPVTLLVTEGGEIGGQVLDDGSGTGIPGVEIRVLYRPSGDSLTETSGPTGDYRFKGLREGDYRIEVLRRVPGFLQDPEKTSRRELFVAAGARLDGVDFLLTRGALLAGVVRDSASEPVADAVVRARNERGSRSQGECIADANGAFSFGDFAEGDSVQLSAESQGAESGLQGPFIAGTAEAGAIELVLSRDCTGIIAGRIIDPEGQPVQAQVGARALDEALQFPVLPPFGWTDGDGRFVLSGACAGNFALTVTPPGLAQQELETIRLGAGETRTGLELVYDPGELYAIAGVVVDREDSPISGARLKASSAGRGPLGPAPSLVTGDDGRFEFSKLPSGTYLVQVTAHGFLPQNFGPVEAGALDLVVSMSTVVPIAGE